MVAGELGRVSRHGPVATIADPAESSNPGRDMPTLLNITLHKANLTTREIIMSPPNSLVAENVGGILQEKESEWGHCDCFTLVYLIYFKFCTDTLLLPISNQKRGSGPIPSRGFG